MIKFNKIVHYSELLGFSRNRDISKVTIKPHSNSTLKNPEVVSCNIYLNIYKDVQKFISIQNGIKEALIKAVKDENIPQHEKEIASGFTAHYVSGEMVWLSVDKWKKVLDFEQRNGLNLNIPQRVKKLIK